MRNVGIPTHLHRRITNTLPKAKSRVSGANYHKFISMHNTVVTWQPVKQPPLTFTKSLLRNKPQYTYLNVRNQLQHNLYYKQHYITRKQRKYLNYVTLTSTSTTNYALIASNQNRIPAHPNGSFMKPKLIAHEYPTNLTYTVTTLVHQQRHIPDNSSKNNTQPVPIGYSTDLSQIFPGIHLKEHPQSTKLLCNYIYTGYRSLIKILSNNQLQTNLQHIILPSVNH
eukprot:gene3095-2077_t